MQWLSSKSENFPMLSNDGNNFSSDGLMIAVGTTEGNISVFDCELRVSLPCYAIMKILCIHLLLQLVNKISKIHSIFITGLTFIKPGNIRECEHTTKEQNKEVLLSISADRTCCVSQVDKKGMYITLIYKDPFAGF